MKFLKTLFLSLLVFQGTALFASGRIVLPALTEKPVIDGKIDAENEYRYATSVANFLRADRLVWAPYRTRVWLAYDKENLYFAFELEDNRLLHESNDRNSFKDSLTGPSQKVWKDECMEIRILPPWVKSPKGFSHFYFAFTPKKATLSIAPDGFDKKFEEKVKVETSYGNGYWYAETAIPLSVFGMPENFKLGQSVWKFNFTRFDSINGCSTWNDLPDGNHNSVKNFGMLHFGDEKTPALKIPDFSKTGIEDFHVQTENRGERLLCSSWNESWPATGVAKLHGIADISVISKGSSRFRIQSTRLTPAEDFIWRWNYTTRVPVKPLYTNPPIRLNKGASLILNGASDVKFNNRIIKPSGGKTVIVPAPGVNTLSFVSDGTAQLVSQSQYPVPGALGKVFEKGSHTVSFLNNVTVLDIPGVDKMHLKLSDGQSYKMQWWAGGIYKYLPQDSVDRIALNFILPEGIEISAYANDERHPDGFPLYRMGPHIRLYQMEKHPVEINGKKFTRFEIWTDKFKLIGNENPIYFPYRVECFILIKANRQITGEKTSLAYYVEVKDKNGTRVELPGSLPVKVLPRINGAQTGKIIAYYKSRGIKDDAFAEGSFSFLRDIGVDRVFSLMCNNPISGKYNIGGIANGQLENSAVEPDRIDLGALFRKYPKARANLVGGKYPNLVYLNRNEEPWEMVDAAVAELRKRNPLLKDFLWDFEYPPFSRYSDTSADSMKIFAETYKLPEVPTQAVVQKKYMKEWIDFRCRELGTFSGKLKKVLNKYGFRFGFYCGPPSEYVRKNYSYDPNFVSVDEFMVGGTATSDQNKEMLALARKNNAKLVYSSHLCSVDRTGTGRGILMRRFMLNRNGGLLLWYELGFDAEDAAEVGALSRVIKSYGHFFESGKADVILPKGNVLDMAKANHAKEDVADRMLNDNSYRTVAMVVYRSNGKFAAPVLNETKNAVKLKISFPDAEGDVTEAFSGKVIKAGTTWIADIPSEGALFFVGNAK